MDQLAKARERYTPGPGECWLWTGWCEPSGYPKWGSKYAHRRMYELLVAPIPPKMTIDHLCRVRHCVNPSHMEVVSRWENVKRAPDNPAANNVRKTHCPEGHPYSHVDHRGWRKCRTCINARRKVRRATKRAALRSAD